MYGRCNIKKARMTQKSQWSIIICTILCCIGTVTPVVICTVTPVVIYNIEDMCNSAGSFDVDSDVVVYLRGGYSNSPITVRECNAVLRATTGDHILSFEEPTINLQCGNALDIIYGSYKKAYACDTLASGKFSTQTRDATVKLTLGTNMASRFGTFQLQISAGIKPVDASQNSASAWSVGIIVGTVVGICVFLLLICIIGVCMHKKMRQAKMNEAMYATQDKGRLELDITPNKNFGYTNSYNENGEASPAARTKLLNGYDENRRLNRPDTLNIRSAYTKPVPAKDPRVQTINKDYQDDGDDTYYNMDEDKIIQPNRPKTPVTPILSALQSNPKFRKSYTENERDAEDRAKRISYSTSNDSINQRPPLPKVPDSNTRQVNLKKNQSMRKATRPDSYVDWSSSTQGSEEMEDERAQNKETTERPKHTLRPNRKRSPEQDRKQTNKMKDPRINDLRDDEDERIGLFQKQSSTRSSARSSKRSQRSPRLGKGSKGFGHRRTGSRGDDAISIGSRTDLESLPPLQRSSSKTSLYASRSSLYSRRRSGRDRAGSCADSVVSYAHDDIDFYRRSRRSHTDYDDEDDFGGYEKPISRNDRLRMSKSDHDLGRAMREISTQTLRETATQTGLEEPVTVHTKRTVKRRPRSRSMSAMGTQTQKKEKTKKRTKSKQDLAATTDDELHETEVKPAVKPKPKPKPRKSLSTADHAAQSDNEGIKKKKMRRRSKSDAHIAKSLEDLTHESNDEAVPGPQVPQHIHSSHTVPANLQSYGPPGAIVVPPPYTTLPHGAQPTQFVTSQGQPVMVQTQPVAMPYPGNPPRPVVPPQYPVAHVPGKPRKSNWETLMEMTDKKKAGLPTDTESVVSSVFTSNPPPTYQPGQPAFFPYQQGYSQPHIQQQPVQQFQPPQPQQVQQPPVQSSAQYPPSSGWTLQPGGGSDGSSSGTTGSGSSTSGMYVTQPQGLPPQGKSSWDKLTEMTNQQYKIAYTSEKNDRSESIV
ncbi:unnamed protein product [Mytilus coruscus]|uniref:CUB domain-containing protein n=1 Tax=Mytilus coruscus TaxID=42192 RepID=A0A6J8E766_MYTCO|nr:unnamed protein product [Mytilus coruscus]CAC5415873.1 unnamed protein product [Mytilus coruscus]